MEPEQEKILSNFMEKRDNQKENNELNEVVPTTDDRQKRYKEEFFKLKLKEQNETSSSDAVMNDGGQLPNVQILKDPNFYCSVCDLYTSSTSTYNSHMNGTKHFKNSRKRYLERVLKGMKLKALQCNKESANEDYGLNEGENSEIDEKFKNLNTLGLEFIEEIKGAKIHFRCSLCEKDFPCASVIIDHLLGKKHKHKYNCQNDAFEEPSAKKRKKHGPNKETILKAKEEFWKAKSQENSTDVGEKGV